MGSTLRWTKRRSWPLTAAGALVLALGSTAWWVTHPDVFDKAGGFGVGGKGFPAGGTWYFGAVITPERDERRTLELKSATPVVRSDTADAELEVFLCEVDPAAEVAGVGAQRREPTNICRVFEPVSEGMRFLTGGGEPRHELILRVRTTQPGVVRVEGIEISYRDGLRRGTQVTGADVTVRARADRSRQR